MNALEQFEAAEANLVKLERIWDKMLQIIGSSITFGQNVEYENLTRAFIHVLPGLPKIEGWRPSATPASLSEISQSRIDALEINEPNAIVSVEEWIEEPGLELRNYRFRFNSTRRSLVRSAIEDLVEKVEADIANVRANVKSGTDRTEKLPSELWSALRDHMKQIEVLLGSSIVKPFRWSDMARHAHFGFVGDLHDIETTDWPEIKAALRESLNNTDDPIPVTIDDLSLLVAERPAGPVATELNWSNVDDQTFERIVFALISNTAGYENPEWLMQTRAPDRGRDLSITRVTNDLLSGVIRSRIVIQCKHWKSRSVRLPDVSATKDQMSLWQDPRVDVLVIATSGRFTLDAVHWIEQHNTSGTIPRIEMWPDSHLERLLSARPDIIAEYQLR